MCNTLYFCFEELSICIFGFLLRRVIFQGKVFRLHNFELFFSSSTVETRNFIVFCYVCYNKVVAITVDIIADKIIDMSTVYIRLLYI